MGVLNMLILFNNSKCIDNSENVIYDKYIQFILN